MILINTKNIRTIVFSEELKLTVYKYKCIYKRKYVFFGSKVYYECWKVGRCSFTKEEILEDKSLKVIGDSVYRKAYLEIDKIKFYFALNQDVRKALDKIITANPSIVVIQ